MTALTFHEPTHKYFLHSTPVPSVTGMLSILDKPGLHFAAAREAALFASRNIDALAWLDEPDRIDQIKKAPQIAWREAARLGTAVHATIEAAFRETTITASPETADHTLNFFQFWNKQRFIIEHSEAMCYSAGPKPYAGTLDLIATDPNGDRWLLDIKTGKGPYPTHGFQLAAYAAAETLVVSGHDRPMPKIDKLGVLMVTPSTTTLHTLTNTEETTQTWTQIRNLHGYPTPTFQTEGS